MKTRTLAVVAVLVMATAGCAGGSDDAGAANDELAASQAKVQAVEAERDELASQVSTLQQRIDELEAGAPGTTIAAETTTTGASVTTAPAPAGDPAALDSSPFVVAFGDIGVVALPAGDDGEISILTTDLKLDRSRSVPVIVRNNTKNAISRIEVTGVARDGAGSLAGSGSSQGFQPAVVQPGEIAWGYVYFGDVTGSDLTFELSATGEEPTDYVAALEVTEFTATGDKIVGVVVNNSDRPVSGPISVDGVCFDEGGALLGTISSFAEQDELEAGASGSFSIDLYGEPCSIGLLAASGYNF